MARRLPALRPEGLDDAQRALGSLLLEAPGRVEVAADVAEEQAALDAAAELLRTGDLTDAAWARTVDALGEAGTVELSTLVVRAATFGA